MSEDLKVLFHDVADLPAGEREAYYSNRHVPAAARAELESLFTFDESPGDSLSVLVGSAAEQFLRSSVPVSEDGRCGPYRLVQLLGNGGMGAVYLAERVDGEVEQQVAIKFVRAGASLPSFRERFLRERQILASLNHPGIARLLDAGHTGGQPYLVMEFVDGVRIDSFVSGLDTGEILAVFLRVCEAVSYAHRNLIIHRDLKPSNILIDAGGQPKLLDFGIAKIMDAPEETRTIDRLLTPEYASPEQVRGDAQATTTDVYSLGAVLYRLLTGESPHVPGLPAGQQLPQDLELIIRKAMRNEPEERYASVEAFSDDIRAYLEYRPVRARRGNAWYVTRMFLRRYWLPVAAAAFAVAGLAGGMILAERERAVAERRFQQVRQLSNKFFELDSEIRSLAGATRARHSIVAASLEYLEGLGSEVQLSRWRTPSEQDTDLTLEIGSAYLQVARLQGIPGQSNLGQFDQARQSLSRADAFVESVLAAPAYPHRRTALLRSAEIAHDSMILAQTELREADGLAFAQKAAERLDTLLAAADPDTKEAAVVSRIFSNIALFSSNTHRLDDATRYARRTVDISRRFGNDKRQLSAGLGMLSNAARFSGDLEGALRAIRESRALAEETTAPDDTLQTLNLGAALWREALILGELNNINMDRPQEAVPLLEKSLALAEGIASKDPDDYLSRTYVAMNGTELGDILRDSNPARALEVYDHTRRRMAEVKDNSKARRYEVWALAGSSYALRRLRRPDESRQRIDAAFAILRDLKDYPAAGVTLGEAVDAALRALADHYAGTGQTAAAIATCEELLEKVLASNPHPDTVLRHANGISRIYRDLANLRRRAGDVSRAATLDQQRLELWRHWDKKLPNNPFVRRQFPLLSEEGWLRH
jgi:predicted Ser/Thr protein kinase/tetratricopeptide (TPR) repeat protein